MTKIKKNSATVPRNNMSNIRYFEITSLSFKIRMHSGKSTCEVSIAFVGNVRFYTQFHLTAPFQCLRHLN